MKLSEQIDGMAAQVASLTDDVARLTGAAEQHKADLVAAQAAWAVLDEDNNKALAAATEREQAAQATIADLTAKLATETARAEAAEAKLTLAPALKDVSAGQSPVADGGAAAEITDWIKAVEAKTGAERTTFYRANREQIDRAYAQRGR
jgi:hypothetical protein